MQDTPVIREKYWASEETKKFAKEFFSRSSTGPTPFLNFATLVVRALRAFYGTIPVGMGSGPGFGPSSAFVGRDGEQGEISTLKVNWARSHILAKHGVVTQPSIAWQAQAINSDSKSRAAAKRASSILEYIWKEEDFHARCISAALGALLCGEEFIFNIWDESAGQQMAYDEAKGAIAYSGDLKTYNLASWDVIRDPSVRDFNDCRWLTGRIPGNRWELIAQHPDMVDAIKKVSSAPTGQFPGVSSGPTAGNDPDTVAVYHFFHKKTSAMPTGRHAIMLSEDCILKDGPLEECYERLPIIRMAAGDIKGTPYGYTDFWEVLGTQEMLEDLYKSICTNAVTYGVQMISVEDDSDAPPLQITDGPKLLKRPKGSQPPVPLNLMPPQDTLFKGIQQFIGDMRQVLGLNDMNFGQPPPGAPNATAWALLLSESVQQNSDLQRRYVKFCQEVGRSVLHIFKENATEPRKLVITGKHGAMSSTAGEYSKHDLAGFEDVHVELAPQLSQTSAGRLSLAQLYIQQGFVTVPEQLEQVVSTGIITPLTEGLSNELIFLAEENEALMRGENPPVKITDSHKLHIEQHKNTSFNMASRNDPAINQALDAHIQGHLEFLLNPSNTQLFAAMGQASLAPQGAPNGPGGPQAGAPGTDLQSMLSPPGMQKEAGDMQLPGSPTNPVSGQPLGGTGGGTGSKKP